MVWHHPIGGEVLGLGLGRPDESMGLCKTNDNSIHPRRLSSHPLQVSEIPSINSSIMSGNTAQASYEVLNLHILKHNIFLLHLCSLVKVIFVGFCPYGRDYKLGV